MNVKNYSSHYSNTKTQTFSSRIFPNRCKIWLGKKSGNHGRYFVIIELQSRIGALL